jgi:hypothetical protein
VNGLGIRFAVVAVRPCAAAALLLSLAGAVGLLAANPIVVQEPGRGPYAIVREAVSVTVGRSVSRVVGDYEFLYVRVYDSKDRLDPVLIDVPVIVRAQDIEPGRVLKIAQVQLAIGRNVYPPRDVLLLDHEAYEPVPWLPEGARIAMVSFSIPRQGLKPRFRARISYDQPHVDGADGAGLSTYLPLLPDYDQLQDVLHFKRDDFVVTFTALPEVSLRHDSVNAHVAKASPEMITVHPRNRETIAVVVTAVAK